MRRLVASAALVALVGAAIVAPVSLARFTASGTSAGSFTTGTILAPTGLGASGSGTTVTLSWTPTTSTAATGYDVLRSTSSGSGYSVVSSVTPRTAASTTNSPGNGTFYYVLQSVYQNWRSANSNEVSIAVGATSTGLKGCANNAADTGGDGDGYQTNAGNGCAVDGSVAVDANSGSNTVLSCADSGKDRHRFWGYAFGLPGSVSAVNGISVQLDAGLNNNGGTSILCAQLSWDGGTTWTATQQVTLSGSSVTTYTLGGAAYTWGRTWTLANLGTAAFRVRIIDVSNQPSKNFRLDGVQVAVNYTP